MVAFVKDRSMVFVNKISVYSSTGLLGCYRNSRAVMKDNIRAVPDGVGSLIPNSQSSFLSQWYAVILFFFSCWYAILEHLACSFFRMALLLSLCRETPSLLFKPWGMITMPKLFLKSVLSLSSDFIHCYIFFEYLYVPDWELIWDLYLPYTLPWFWRLVYQWNLGLEASLPPQLYPCPSMRNLVVQVRFMYTFSVSSWSSPLCSPQCLWCLSWTASNSCSLGRLSSYSVHWNITFNVLFPLL